MPAPASELRRPGLWLAGLSGLAFSLRAIGIGANSLWFDEAVSYLAARLPLADLLTNAAQSSHPPLYYLILKAWLAVAPEGDGWLRAPSLLFGVLLVPAVYALGLGLFGQERLGLTAAGLVAISPFHILYAHELRMYTLLMLLVTAGAYAYWRALGAGGRWWAAAGLLWLAAAYSHLFAWLCLAGLGLHALWRGRRAVTLRVGLMIALIALLFSPWALGLLAEPESELGSLRPLAQAAERNPLKPLSGLAFLLFGMSARRGYTGLALFLSLGLLIILPLEARKAWRAAGKPAGGPLALGLIMVGLVVGLPASLYLAKPYFLPERSLAAAAPFLAVLLAWGVGRRASPLPWLALASAGLMAVGAALYLSGPAVKPPYRDALALVAELARPDDVVLHTSDGSYLPALRYLPERPGLLLAGDPDPRKPDSVYVLLGGQRWGVEQAAGHPGRLWLVVALEHSLEWQQAQLAVLDARRQRLEEHNVGGIQIILYAGRNPEAVGLAGRAG
ncbi:MAG: glycosyltransferase family 39 protein [Candidatus Promineifilaceae bacterium]